MHVAHVIAALDPVAGAERVLQRIVASLPDIRHSVVSLATIDPAADPLVLPGAEIHSLGQRRGRLTPAAIVRLRRILKGSDVDAIQSWMYHGCVAASLACLGPGGPPVHWGIHHANLSPRANRPSTLRVVRVARALSHVSSPHRIVYCADAARAAHVAAGFADARSLVIPNGYDLQQFRPDPDARMRLRAAWSVKTDQIVFGCVARWNEQKDHRTLLAAFAKLVERQTNQGHMVPLLILAGGGMTGGNKDLRAVLESEGLVERVRLCGDVTNIQPLMAALDIHVLSSIGEAFPNVLAESMACAVPCISTDVGDAALIIGDTGWLTPPGDPEALANTLFQAYAACRDRSTWQASQGRARARIEHHYELSGVAARYDAMWRGVPSC